MRSLFTLFAIHALACLPAIAQTKQVLKTISTNGITESLVVPSGKTLTIASGATLTAASGSTITGIGSGSGLTIGSSTITSGTSGRALYNNSGVLGELDLASLYAPIASPTFTGTITTGTGGIVSPNPLFPTRNITISQGVLYWSNVAGSGFSVQLAPLTPTADRIVNFNPNGAIVSTADTGTVTNAMLAGSIALSKLATTGTASSSTYLRGDGAWTAIDLSSYLTTASAASTYLPLAGGTMTGGLVINPTSGAPLTVRRNSKTCLEVTNAEQINIGRYDGVFASGSSNAIGWSGLYGGGLWIQGGSGNWYSSFIMGSGSGEFRIASDGGGTNALRLFNASASMLQLGANHATATTNQAIKAHDVTTGTGAALNLRGGNGSVAGGAVTISTSVTTTPAVRMTVKASGVINMSGMPTSSAGLSSGDLWKDRKSVV